MQLFQSLAAISLPFQSLPSQSLPLSQSIALLPLHFQQLSLRHLYQVDAAQHSPKMLPRHPQSFLVELFIAHRLPGLSEPLDDDCHEFVIVALLVLEVPEQEEVVGEEVVVIWQIVEVRFEQFLGVLIVLVVFDDIVGVLDQDVGEQLNLLCFLLVLDDQGVVQALRILPLLVPYFKLDMPQHDFNPLPLFLQLHIHLPGLVRVLSLLQVAPVEVQLSVELVEEAPVVSEHAQHLRVFVGLILQVVDHLFPQLNPVSLSHQHSLVAVGGILHNPVLPLQPNQLPPYLHVRLDLLGIGVEVKVLDLLFKGDSFGPVSESAMVSLNDVFAEEYFDFLGRQELGAPFRLFGLQQGELFLRQGRKPCFKERVDFLQIKQRSDEDLLEKLVPVALVQQMVVFQVNRASSAVSPHFHDRPLDLFAVLCLILIQWRAFHLLEVAFPQLERFGVLLERDLEVFRLREIDVLNPVLKVEGKVVEKYLEAYDIGLLAIFLHELQELLPSVVLLKVSGLLGFLQKKADRSVYFLQHNNYYKSLSNLFFLALQTPNHSGTVDSSHLC